MYKLSSSVKTSLGVGKIAMTQKRLFLLTEGRPGYVEIATFRDMEVGAAPAAPGLGGSAARADPRTLPPASHGPRLSLLTCQVGWDGTDLVGNALRAVGVPGGLPCVGEARERGAGSFFGGALGRRHRRSTDAAPRGLTGKGRTPAPALPGLTSPPQLPGGPCYLFCNDVSVPFPLEEPELSSSLILGLLFPGVFPKLVSGR